jgi:hypothetical protein
MRSRLLKTLMTNSGLFASGQGKQVAFYEGVEQYRGRKPALLLWRAVRFGWLGPLAAAAFHPRKIEGAAAHLAEPDYRDLKSKKAIVVPFATRDGNEPHIEKFAQPVIDALGDRGLVMGVGTWDKITNRPRLEDINGYFNRRWHYPAAVIVRLGVKKADLEKYARVVAALEAQTGFSLDPMRTFPRWMLRVFFIEARLSQNLQEDRGEVPFRSQRSANATSGCCPKSWHEGHRNSVGRVLEIFSSVLVARFAGSRIHPK